MFGTKKGELGRGAKKSGGGCLVENQQIWFRKKEFPQRKMLIFLKGKRIFSEKGRGFSWTDYFSIILLFPDESSIQYNLEVFLCFSQRLENSIFPPLPTSPYPDTFYTPFPCTRRRRIKRTEKENPVEILTSECIAYSWTHPNLLGGNCIFPNTVSG